MSRNVQDEQNNILNYGEKKLIKKNILKTDLSEIQD